MLASHTKLAKYVWFLANCDAAKRIGAGKIIMGFGYDDSQLKEKRHPTRQELDAVSKDKPVLIVHQSGHIGVANSKALDLFRITTESKDPVGCVIRREADGKTPNGVLEETAWIPLIFTEVLPFVSEGNERFFIEKAQLAYLRTTGQNQLYRLS